MAVRITTAALAAVVLVMTMNLVVEATQVDVVRQITVQALGLVVPTMMGRTKITLAVVIPVTAMCSSINCNRNGTYVNGEGYETTFWTGRIVDGVSLK